MTEATGPLLGVKVLDLSIALTGPYAAALLVRALRRAGLDTAPMKPFCCGDRGDAEALHLALLRRK